MESIQEPVTAQGIALFVFIPFCKIRCTYCDFNAYANMARVVEPYAAAVQHEIANVAANPAANGSFSGCRARSVYFGGGTPSMVPVGHIAGILSELERSYAVSAHGEITLEANPGTLDYAKLCSLHALGVNRLSLGVQSFDDVALKRLNRGHTVADALDTYNLARRAGFSNVSLDLIYGLPLQSLPDWRSTLDRALALKPEHLSLYALKVEEGTGLDYQIKRGKYPQPDDDLAADMYELANDALRLAGYEHYEISNWARLAPLPARPEDSYGEEWQIESPFRSIHNLTYWRNEPYLGFGAGAHSSANRARYWNVLSPVEYIRRATRGESCLAEREEIGRELEMAETMFLGLRLREGIAFATFEDRFGVDAERIYARQLIEVRDLGLVELSDCGVRLTPRGRLLSNEVFWRFLPD